MRRELTYLAAMLLVGTVILTGCGKVEHKAESKIAEALQEKIGPARHYDVNIKGSPLKLVKGKMDRLDIVGDDVQLKAGITIAKLNVSVYGLNFDRDSQQIKSAEKTTYSATITEREMQKYLDKHYPDIPELKIELKDGLIGVSAKPEKLGVGVNIKAESELQIEDHQKLVIDLKKITAAGVPAPEFARNYIETRFNPVFNSADMGFNATVNSITIRKDSVTMSGGLDLVAKEL